MNNIIKYIMIAIFFIMLSYFTGSLVNDTPDFLSEGVISFLFLCKDIMDKPLVLFSFFFSEEFVNNNVFFFNIVIACVLAFPVTWAFSEKKNDYDEFVIKSRPYILTEYEYIDKAKKENVMPYHKKEKILDKLGLLKKTNIEKEVFYNISLHLPDEIRKVFSYQIKKAKRMDRFIMPDEPTEAYSFFSFKSIIGTGTLKNTFPQSLLKSNGVNNEFILATVLFKDREHNTLFVDVWVKNLRLDKIVFKSIDPIDLNKNYDYTYSVTKINIVADKSK